MFVDRFRLHMLAGRTILHITAFRSDHVSPKPSARIYLAAVAMLSANLSGLNAHAQAVDASGGTEVGTRRAPDFVAIGAGIAPKYEGSDKFRVIPFAIGDIHLYGTELELRGTNARLDVVGGGAFAAGPAFNVRLDRKSSAGTDRGSFGRIPVAAEAGGFVRYRLGGNAVGEGAIDLSGQILADVSSVYKGVVGTATVSYAAVRTLKYFVTADVSTTIGDAKYQRRYFGVTPEVAARTGLAAYDPGAGVRDVTVGATGGLQLTRRIGVIGRVAYARLVDKSGDSPIARDKSRDQLLTGVAVSYRF